MKEILIGKIHGYFSQVSLDLLIGASASYCQGALVGVSEMIRTHMGKHNRSVMVAVYGTPCAVPSRMAR
jgi:hypothetical protein